MAAATAGLRVRVDRAEGDTRVGSSSVTTPTKPTRTPPTSLMKAPLPPPSALKGVEPETLAARIGKFEAGRMRVSRSVKPWSSSWLPRAETSRDIALSASMVGRSWRMEET